VILSRDSVWCDVTEFESAYRSKDFELAASILTAPLLPAIYDEWASADQLRYELLREELLPYCGTNQVEAIQSTERSRTSLHRLPFFLSRFLSREKEISLLFELVERNRLVTITGPGGVGKTRISVEVCERSAIRTVFVPLAECSNRDELGETIVRYLSIHSQTSLDPFQQLTDVLSRLGPIRLLLDNAEHLVDDVADFASGVLDAVPELQLVVSSRQVLDVGGEQVFRLDPLELPLASQANSIQYLEQFPSTLLFLDRVRQSRPDFVPTEAQASSIVEICRRLEGLPLAIELAAAQITVNSVGKILEGLERSLVDLKSRRRSLSSRHRSLRAAIKSSFDGLDTNTANFLGKLSVFWGGWTVENAEAITDDELAIEKLEILQARSLVNSEMADDTMRFTCLEVVRQLAQEALTESEIEETSALHSQYYRQIASMVDENDLRTLCPLDNEVQNINIAFHNSKISDNGFWDANRGALAHSFIRGQFRTALKWIREYGPFVEQCESYSDRRNWRFVAVQVLPELGLYDEGLTLLEVLREDAYRNQDQLGTVFADIENGLIFARLGNLTEAIGLHRVALEQARTLGNTIILESALSHLSGSLHEVGRIEGTSLLERDDCLHQAETLAIELIQMVSTQSRRHPLAYLLAGVATFYQRKFEGASTYFSLASTSALRHGVTTVSMYSAFFESEIARELGQTGLAETKLQRFRQLRDQTGIIFGSGKWG
jgi:predicted ATPase